MVDIISTPSISSQPHTISGIFLAKNRRSPRARAWLAAELLDGEAVLVEPTVSQIALICRTSPTTIKRFRNGHNGHNGNHKPLVVVLAKAWSQASPEQRLAFVKNIGTEPLWTALTAAL
jgi:hypothetical protein